GPAGGDCRRGRLPRFGSRRFRDRNIAVGRWRISSLRVRVRGQMELGLDGKVAVVTGGTSGIGLAIARRLLEEGARVFLCGRDETRLQDAITSLAPAGEVAG